MTNNWVQTNLQHTVSTVSNVCQTMAQIKLVMTRSIIMCRPLFWNPHVWAEGRVETDCFLPRPALRLPDISVIITNFSFRISSLA